MNLILASRIERYITYIGTLTAWLTLCMVVMMGINVMLRYIFSTGAPWQQEIVRFMHAIVFLLGAAYAYQKDEHVRVDIFYQHFNTRGKAWVNLLGVCMLLFPLCAAIIYFSYDTILASWSIFEGSNEYNGLPGVFLLKSGIWGCAALLCLQGCAIICRSIEVIRGG